MKKFSDIIQKSGEPDKNAPSGVIKGRVAITKSDDDKMLAFGWANVSLTVDGEMHERGGAAVLIESVVFTEEKMKAIGIPEGTLPVGWWIGFKVLDEDVWEKVKNGEYPMFSIEGEAERVEVDNDNGN